MARTSIIVVVICAAIASAQTPSAQPTEYQVRRAARVAMDEARGDYLRFMDPFLREMRSVYPELSGQLAPTVCSSDTLEVGVTGPGDSFAWSVREAMRRMDPADQVPWPSGVAVYVSPSDFGAKDIDKVVVTRAGVIMAPLSSSLRPTVMLSRNAAPFTIHAGRIMYPVTAFEPGAEVTVTAIPIVGDNCRRTYLDADLKKIF